MKLNDSRFEPIDSIFVPVSLEGVRDIENNIGAELPPDYRDFLTTYGACGFPSSAHIEASPHSLPIFTFFGGGTDAQSVSFQLRCHPDLQEEKLLPIGDDLYANLYVLDLKKDEIFYIDYTANPPVAIRAADSFSNLLEKLRFTPGEA